MTSGSTLAGTIRDDIEGRVRDPLASLDGQSIEVPGSGGALTGEALARDDFSDLAPR